MDGQSGNLCGNAIKSRSHDFFKIRIFSADIDNDTMFAEADRLFRTEWGDYPKLGSIQRNGNGWLKQAEREDVRSRSDAYILLAVNHISNGRSREQLAHVEVP